MVHLTKVAVRGVALLAATATSGGLLMASMATPTLAAPRDPNTAAVQVYPPCTRTLIDHCQQIRHSPRPDARQEAALVRRQQEAAS
ncbi:hypothetical protein M0208_09315 [Sphingomonas sp. SUN019]|uniref:hypothetical protein n=1 Tax=Sphingomonas sp. SUN019 TaxID=2937788 RepID=UPI0021645E0E|nr:hypothetical protein [Sphingomonas sp. SUN019]UVO50708.1 hypothetical protein M0208_09315 [Sphingomonas sp. SUN019]